MIDFSNVRKWSKLFFKSVYFVLFVFFCFVCFILFIYFFTLKANRNHLLMITTVSDIIQASCHQIYLRHILRLQFSANRLFSFMVLFSHQRPSDIYIFSTGSR